MAGYRLLPHTITLFNFVGENESSYRGDYVVSVLKNVMCIPYKGAVLSSTGTNPNDNADLYIFECNVIATDEDGNIKLYLPPDRWDESSNRDRYWTLHDNGTDIFVKGNCTTNNLIDTLSNIVISPDNESLVWSDYKIQSPDELDGSMRIDGVVHYDMGTPRMRHWEVYAR